MMTSSTLSDNSAGFGGGGVFNVLSMTIRNSTVSNNSAGSQGGGIWTGQSIPTMTISTSTLSGNSAGSQGGGIHNFFSTSIVNIKNSIVANSPLGGNCSNTGTFTSTGTNLASDGTCPGFTQVTSSQLSLGPLQVNPPGTTATQALGFGSVAINAVTDCTLQDGVTPVTQDQRGVSRPQGGLCDVGSYEFIGLGTPQQVINLIIDDVEELVNTGVLNSGQGNSLISKLQAAIAALNQGNTTAACNELQAFINQVNALISAGVLTPAQGQPLIGAANDLRNKIGCS
jgi:hypothetical protein